MTVQAAAVLKGYFNTGDVPSEANFSDLIDSVVISASVTVVDVAKTIRSTSYGAPPTSGAGVELFYSSGTGVGNVMAYDRSTSTNKELSLGLGGLALKIKTTGTVEADRTFRSIGFGTPASGEGLEMFYNTATHVGTILAYDRTGAAAKELNLGFGGSQLKLSAAGTVTIDKNLIVAGTGDTTFASTKMGFFAHAAAAQPAHIIDATDAASVITRANAIIAALEAIGILAAA